MEKFNKRQRREQLQVVAQSSKNWNEKSILTHLKKYVYPTNQEVLTFSEYFFIGVGTILFLAGVMFFFAYNWADLHKFAKLGIIQGGLIAVGIGSLFIQKREFSIKIVLTVLSFLTGVLFAVFGQIYQTGADAYDLFLMWCFAITIWVVISNFPPLWYFYFLLIQTTIILYKVQIARYNADFSSEFILFGCGVLFLITWNILEHFTDKFKQHQWFPKVMILQAFGFITSLITRGIFISRTGDTEIYGIAVATYLVISGGLVFYSFKKQNLFNISVLAISVCTIIYCLLIDTIEAKDAGAFLLISVCIITTSSLVFFLLVHLHKKWNTYATVN